MRTLTRLGFYAGTQIEAGSSGDPMQLIHVRSVAEVVTTSYPTTIHLSSYEEHWQGTRSLGIVQQCDRWSSSEELFQCSLDDNLLVSFSPMPPAYPGPSRPSSVRSDPRSRSLMVTGSPWWLPASFTSTGPLTVIWTH